MTTIKQETEKNVNHNGERLLANGMTIAEWQKELARIKMIKQKNGELY